MLEAWQTAGVQAIGKRTSDAILCGPGGCTVATVESDVYSPSPEREALRTMRLDLGLSLRQAAQRVGLLPRTLSDLEQGRRTLASQTDWPLLMVALRRA